MIDVCIICARKNSKEIKNKNLIKVQGVPLIVWSIKQALKTKIFYKVYVSTDSKKIANISIKHGADVPFLRDKKLSENKTSKFLVWKDALKRIELITKKKVRFFVDLDCTNPIRFKKDIVGVIEKLKKNKKADGVVTTCKSRKNPYFNMVEKTKNQFLKISKKTHKNVTARQLAPKVHDIVANIYCLRADYLKKSKNLLSGKILGYELKQNQSFDIDSKFDLEITNLFLKKLKNNV